MKKSIHPKYQQVLFVDSATGHRFVCGSTLQSAQTETFEGKQYPVVPVSTSSASHPFFTGSKQLVDAEGRVEKFNKRFRSHVKKEASGEEGQEQQEGQGQEEKNKEAQPESKAPKKAIVRK
ncbi:MAG: type B 50S ribosomal protein L31 [Parachlamydiaceae bacterium]|nr:type B 50S ribosomal protein L31 [Parachlamydiaceae bacterium]